MGRKSRQAAPGTTNGKPSKYRNVKVTIDGLTFDSKREAKRFTELKALERAGEIDGLRVQPSFPIFVHRLGHQVYIGTEQERIRCGEYIADFRYWRVRAGGINEPAGEVVEDVKGVRTDVYRLKKKLVEGIYGITIREI